MAAVGDWYEAQRSGLGLDFVEEVERALDVIGENPAAWSRWPGAPADMDIRRFLLPRFPFALAYLVVEGRATVAVAHGRRRPGYWLGRSVRSR
jgi:hypothetical protein